MLILAPESDLRINATFEPHDKAAVSVAISMQRANRGQSTDIQAPDPRLL